MVLRSKHRHRSRLDKFQSTSIQNWKKPEYPEAQQMHSNCVLNCGWGRLLFAHTFENHVDIAKELLKEKKSFRDIAFYVRDPHVLLAQAPHQLFLDPSHTYRIWFDQYQLSKNSNPDILVRRIQTQKDIAEANRILQSCSMIELDPSYVWQKRNSRSLIFLVAQDIKQQKILGTVVGVDHKLSFNDPEKAASLWSLAVDPQSQKPGSGEALVRYLIETFLARANSFMDVSVMHNNQGAITLYQKLGFQRVPVFCVKRKNSINEPLYIAPNKTPKLNPYGQIIVTEAKRRGIQVDILDAKAGFFELSFGGRTIRCRESLTDLTSAYSLSLCDDKRLTRKVLKKEGLNTVVQKVAGNWQEDLLFLKEHKQVVVKPKSGEQGQGIAVDLRGQKDLKKAIKNAAKFDSTVLLEKFYPGFDVRVIVIGYKVVAAAYRKPAQVVGDGRSSVQKLIDKANRRKKAIYGGESKITIDDELLRFLKKQKLTLDSIIKTDEIIVLKKTANVHTGGTIHDMTSLLNLEVKNACVRAAQSLGIPVVGFDLILPKLDGNDYVFIEANERPGLANHEPQPTQERFIDLLFPQTIQ